MKKINGVVISDAQGGYSFVGTEPDPSIYVDQTTAGVLTSFFELGQLTSESFPIDRDVKFKLFYRDLQSDGDFDLRAVGYMQRGVDGSNFEINFSDIRGLRYTVADWTAATLDATVSVIPVAPATTASFYCVLGVAPDLPSDE